MPERDEILGKVKKTGVNEAMRDYKPPKGTTMVRTREDARKVV